MTTRPIGECVENVLLEHALCSPAICAGLLWAYRMHGNRVMQETMGFIDRMHTGRPAADIIELKPRMGETRDGI